jgi:hypothetical protein
MRNGIPTPEEAAHHELAARVVGADPKTMVAVEAARGGKLCAAALARQPRRPEERSRITAGAGKIQAALDRADRLESVGSSERA